MNTFIFRVSVLRVKNPVTNLSKDQKEEAFRKYENNFGQFCANASWVGDGYHINDHYDYLWYAIESEEQFINISIDRNHVNKILAQLKQMLLKEKLNPIMEALMCQEYMSLAQITQKQLANILNRTQGAISNKIRLLNLPVQIQKGILNNKIKERHGRSILKLEKQDKFYEKAMVVYVKIVENNLSVIQTEDMVDLILGKQIGVRDSLNIKEIRDINDYKVVETPVIVNEIDRRLNETLSEIKLLFPRLDVTLSHGVDRKDYVFLLKLKGLNDG